MRFWVRVPKDKEAPRTLYFIGWDLFGRAVYVSREEYINGN